MAYISKDLMIKLFGEKELIELTDRTSSGVISDEVLAQAMATAEAEADSYVGVLYQLPLPSTPPSLQSFVADIARYHLYDAQPSELVITRYEHAVKWFTNVAKGVVSLGLKITDVQPTGGAVAVVARDQVFTDTLFSKMVGPWHQ